MTNLDKQSPVKEFDLLADEYANEHRKNIRITGEAPDFFSEYKIRDLEDHTKCRFFVPSTILDFGCGIGNSIPFFRKYFPHSQLTQHCTLLTSTEHDASKIFVACTSRLTQ